MDTLRHTCDPVTDATATRVYLPPPVVRAQRLRVHRQVERHAGVQRPVTVIRFAR